jgi:hypothetical protein
MSLLIEWKQVLMHILPISHMVVVEVEVVLCEAVEVIVVVLILSYG